MTASTIGYSPLAGSDKTPLQKGTIPSRTEFESRSENSIRTVDAEYMQKVAQRVSFIYFAVVTVLGAQFYYPELLWNYGWEYGSGNNMYGKVVAGCLLYYTVAWAIYYYGIVPIIGLRLLPTEPLPAVELYEDGGEESEVQWEVEIEVNIDESDRTDAAVDSELLM